MANPASPHQFCTPISPDGIPSISSAPPRPMALARACPGRPSEFSTCFSNSPADNKHEVLAAVSGVDPSLTLSEHGPCLVGGIIALDDASFNTKVAVHSAELTLSRLLVAWRSSTLVPHRPSSGARCWIACSRWGPHPSRANENVPLDPMGVWRICPSANFDKRPPERLFFSRR